MSINVNSSIVYHNGTKLVPWDFNNERAEGTEGNQAGVFNVQLIF